MTSDQAKESLAGINESLTASTIQDHLLGRSANGTATALGTNSNTGWTQAQQQTFDSMVTEAKKQSSALQDLNSLLSRLLNTPGFGSSGIVGAGSIMGASGLAGTRSSKGSTPSLSVGTFGFNSVF